MGLESESEEEVNTANVCFMTNDNTPKVISEPSLDDCELTIYELGEAFEELPNNYDFLKKKYLKMKRENKILQNQVVILSKERMFYLAHFLLHKKILRHTKFLVRPNFF